MSWNDNISTITKCGSKKIVLRAECEQREDVMDIRRRLWPFSNCTCRRAEVRGKCHTWIYPAIMSSRGCDKYTNTYSFEQTYTLSHLSIYTFMFLQALTCKCSQLQPHTQFSMHRAGRLFLKCALSHILVTVSTL